MRTRLVTATISALALVALLAGTVFAGGKVF